MKKHMRSIADTAEERWIGTQMIDREKVLNGLECLAQVRDPVANPCRNCGYADRPNYAMCVVDCSKDALELLKDEPLSVLNVGKCGIYFGDCPHCGKRVTKKNTSYCPYCGKRVKWDG